MSRTFDEKRVPLEELISQAEAARLRGVTRQAIKQLVQRGKFKVYSIGGKILLDRREVRAYKPKRTGRPRKSK
jgi:excisionase family DNA binding protein